MAHLQGRATRRDREGRLQWKPHLVRRLYERGYAHQDVLEAQRLEDVFAPAPAR